MVLLRKSNILIVNEEPVSRFYLFARPVFQFRLLSGKTQFFKIRREARHDQRVFYLKVNRPHHTSYQCIQQWINIAHACNAFCYFVCDNQEMEYEIFKNVVFHNLEFCFITSDRKTLMSTIELTLKGKDYKRWGLIASSMLTPFLHAAKNKYTRSYNIDADDIRILLAPCLVAKALEKVEEYADKENLDCFGLDMFVSRTFSVIWSFGMVYVRTPNKCIEVLKRNENWKENKDLITKYKTDYVLDERIIDNIDLVFTFLRDTEQLNIGTFYIDNSRVIHMPDLLLQYWWAFMLHWKNNRVSVPLLPKFYNEELWADMPIADGVVKIDLGVNDEDFWNHMNVTQSLWLEMARKFWRIFLKYAEGQGKIDKITYDKYAASKEIGT